MYRYEFWWEIDTPTGKLGGTVTAWGYSEEEAREIVRAKIWNEVAPGNPINPVRIVGTC